MDEGAGNKLCITGEGAPAFRRRFLSFHPQSPARPLPRRHAPALPAQHPRPEPRLGLPGPAALLRCARMRAPTGTNARTSPPGYPSADPMALYGPAGLPRHATGVTGGARPPQGTAKAGPRCVPELARARRADHLTSRFPSASPRSWGWGGSSIDRNTRACPVVPRSIGRTWQRSAEETGPRPHLSDHSRANGGRCIGMPPRCYADMGGAHDQPASRAAGLLGAPRPVNGVGRRSGPGRRRRLAGPAARHWGLTARTATWGGHLPHRPLRRWPRSRGRAGTALCRQPVCLRPPPATGHPGAAPSRHPRLWRPSSRTRVSQLDALAVAGTFRYTPDRRLRRADSVFLAETRHRHPLGRRAFGFVTPQPGHIRRCVFKCAVSGQRPPRRDGGGGNGDACGR